MMTGKALGTISWEEELEDLVALCLDVQYKLSGGMASWEGVSGWRRAGRGSFPVFSLSQVRVTQSS